MAAETIPELIRVLESSFPQQWEIVVVDDGGGDFPSGWSPDPSVSLIRLAENRGKGRAVRAGMAQARGRARIYTDIDLPYDPCLIPVMADYLLDDGFHLVIGDRRLPESVFHNRPSPLRSLISAFSTFLIGTLVTGGFFDTQCGIKGISGDVADLLLPLVRTDRFVFDVEVVYLALRFNCTIKRLPVTPGRSNEGSTVRPVVDSLRGFYDLLKIKGRTLSHAYDCPTLQSLVNAPLRDRLTRVRRSIDRSSEALSSGHDMENRP